jgi:predicted nucleic acid-binding protein
LRAKTRAARRSRCSTRSRSSPPARADADETARLRRLHGWKLPDAFQAALARRHGLRLATRNPNDFDPDEHDFVEVPRARSDQRGEVAR